MTIQIGRITHILKNLNRLFFILCFLCFSALTGCGVKGDLTLPEQTNGAQPQEESEVEQE